MRFTEQIKKRLSKIQQFKLQEDRAILLSCFGIALIFWVLVKLSQEYTSQKLVLFTFEMPEEYALANIPPDDVMVTLKGTGWNLMFEHLAGSSIPVSLSIQDRGLFRLNRAQFRTEILAALNSKDLEITQINYDEISLQVEEKLSKRVPIKHRLELSFAPEHYLPSSIQMEPDSVTLTGAFSLIQNYESWPTDSLFFTELTSSTSSEVSLQAPPPEIHLDENNILLTIPVEAYTEKSVFVPITLKNPPSDSLKVFPDKIKISFVVGLSQYDSINYTDFALEADLQTAYVEKGENTVTVRLKKFPETVKNVVLSRNSVEFFILKPNATEEGGVQ